MYFDEVNKQGGVNNKHLEVLVFDDQDDSSFAQAAAEQAAQSRALLVLGHMNSSCSIEAGKVYKDAGIVAITASATTDSVTEDNPWFYRTIPNNRSQSVFLANYARYVLDQSTASIIYDSGAYGTSLAVPFERTFRGLGGEVNHKWSFDSSAPDLDLQLKKIVDEMILMSSKDVGMVFFATYSGEAATLAAQMRRMGIKNVILGGDAVGDPAFTSLFVGYPEEQTRPGYLSNGIYAATPMLFDIAGEKTQQFTNQWMEKYKIAASWDDATYYEAAMLAVDVLRKAEVAAQPDTVQADRLAIRNQLSKIKSVDTAFEGLDGPLYFDNQRNAVKPMTIGIFNHQKFVSAVSQLQPLTDLVRAPNLTEALDTGEVLLVDGKYMYKTKVVYTGLDLIELSELDTKNSTYTADFYLWFRYQGEFDEKAIEFSNTTEPIELGEPVMQSVDGDMNYRVYRVKATFRADFDYIDYPFDSQILRIRFRHPSLTRENLIYVPDVVGMRYEDGKGTAERLKNANGFNAGNSWKLNAIEFFQGVTKYDSTLGYPKFLSTESEVEYSTFNASIFIKRDVIRFATKNLIPLFLLVAIAFTAFLFAPDMLSERFGLGTGSLLTTAFFHMSFVSELPQVGYVVAMEYVFYGIYILYIVIIITAFATYVASKQEKEKLAVRINQIGMISYEAIMLMGLVLLDHTYQITSLPKPVINLSGPAEAAQVAESEAVVLRVSGWGMQNTDPMKRILAKFNEEHPDIYVSFEPFNLYNEALNVQLEDGNAPDLFFIRSYDLSLKMYEEGYLEALNSIPALTENFAPESLAPWTTKDGVTFGVPLIATSHGIYYNQDVFEKLGLSTPTTWQELIEDSQTLKDNGYAPFANGTGTQWTAAETIFMNIAPTFIGGRDGRLAYLNGDRCFNDRNMVAAFKAINDLAPFLPENQTDLTYVDSEELFITGKAAMWLGGSWDIAYFESKSPNFEWSIMPIPPPAGKPGIVTFHPDAGMGLNAASTHKEAARVFIEWLSSPEYAEAMSNELPGFFSMNKNIPTLQNKHANAFMEFNKIHDTDVRFTWDKLMSGLPSGYDLIQNNTIDILDRKTTPLEAANNLQNGLSKWFVPAQECLMK
jgi:branched-chain amino acid transport system substrate-binding protein